LGPFTVVKVLLSEYFKLFLIYVFSGVVPLGASDTGASVSAPNRRKSLFGDYQKPMALWARESA